MYYQAIDYREQQGKGIIRDVIYLNARNRQKLGECHCCNESVQVHARVLREVSWKANKPMRYSKDKAAAGRTSYAQS
tara:strand:- start:112 stop:342 length:231 start_codon:yes stop_codon:yes gene_type:complete